MNDQPVIEWDLEKLAQFKRKYQSAMLAGDVSEFTFDGHEFDVRYAGLSCLTTRGYVAVLPHVWDLRYKTSTRVIDAVLDAMMEPSDEVCRAGAVIWVGGNNFEARDTFKAMIRAIKDGK